MSDVDIRTATPDDEEQVLDLWEAEEMVGDRARGRRELRDAMGQPGGLALVGSTPDGQVVAAVVGFVTSQRAWLHHLAVAPERRREGIGDRIVDEFEARAAAAGADRVTLLVWAHNDAGRAFWRRRGFDERLNVVYATNRITTASGACGTDAPC